MIAKRYLLNHIFFPVNNKNAFRHHILKKKSQRKGNIYENTVSLQ
jgi:hypothetical protein